MDKKYLDRQARIGRDKAQRLAANPAFEKDMVALRKKYRIPPDGIPIVPFKLGSDTVTPIQQWEGELHQRTDKYFEKKWPNTRKEIVRLKQVGKYYEAEKLNQDFNNTAPLNALGRDIKKIIRKHRLSPGWFDGIRRYAITNDSGTLGPGPSVSVSVSHDMEFDLEEMSIKIQKDTRKADLLAIWPDVLEIRKNLPERSPKKTILTKQFARNKRAYELKRSGKSLSEISEIMGDELGKVIGYPDVAKWISEYRRQTEIS